MKPSLVAAAAMLFAAPLAAAPACDARSGERAPVVVELYTSEGCSSCPPADRWLSSLKGRDDLVALAFHVDYWDRLGWVDRFAHASHTARQRRWQQATGARFVYTPQVLADGTDWRRWPALPPPRASVVDVELRRTGRGVEARVAPRPNAPAALAGYWALVENGLSSVVKAGENTGATLHHDHVVRQYRPLPAWRGAQSFAWDDAPAPAPERAVVFVVTDGDAARPLQALALRC